jgi:hypothetical protein
MPEWVTKLGISEPKGLKFDQVFSNFTSENNPSEGFNSVSLVYTGDYDEAVAQAGKLAEKAKLTPGGNFKAKGGPVSRMPGSNNRIVSYMNYSLSDMNQDFLISVQVEPSGSLTIMVTDKKQLDKCLLAYEPLNNRLNSALKRKKQ